MPSRFSDKKEVEKRERNNTPGRAFSADRFTAKHLTMLGLFGIALSKRRAEKKKKRRAAKKREKICEIPIKYGHVSAHIATKIAKC